MKELRTLKDLNFQRDVSDFPTLGEDESLYPKLINKREIKAEAVKWVKEFEVKRKDDLSEMEPNEDVCIFIKHFFNITEEDLK